MLKLILRILIVLGVPLLIGISFYFYLQTYFFDPYNAESKTVHLVELKPGSSFSVFCKELEALGIVRSAWMLEFVSQIKKTDTSIKAGEYELSPAMTPQQILAKLNAGDVFKRIVTVKEGMDIWQIGRVLEEAKVLSSSEFIKAVQDPSLLERLEVRAPSLEGYLFPETYHFSGKQTPLAVIWTMVEQFYKNWNPNYDQKLIELGLSKHEVITLASIIEKESGNVEEQPLISSVFHNRLRSGMRLESDPTLVYGLLDFNGTVLNKHKDTDSPYNTYKNFGLPPGPISNPGFSAIRAAMYPEDSDFLFFVADGKGRHRFSTNLREHNEAVRNYRKFLASQNKNELVTEEELISETEQAPVDNLEVSTDEPSTTN